MFNIKILFPSKIIKWKHLWCITGAMALILLSAFVLLLIMQLQTPVDSNIRLGVGRLTADYALSYKPDSLYTQPKPGEKEARLLSYINYVTWKFTYQLEGFEDLPTDYEYAVDAKLIAQSRDSSKYIDPDFVIWEKVYPLIKPTKITSDMNSGSLTQQVNVDINQYAEFIKSIYQKTEVQTTNELSIVYHVKATVHGPIENTIDNNTVELIVPMVDNLLLVTGTPSKADNLRMVIAPPPSVPNYIPWLLVTGTLALLMLALTAMLTLGVRKPDVEEVFAKSTAKIFKQFGERLVLLQNPLPFQQSSAIPISGIVELIKIADEISQPVFYYKAETVEQKKIEFYVFDSGRIYYLAILGDISSPKEE